LRDLVLDPLDDSLFVLDPVALLESQSLISNPDEVVPPERSGLVPPLDDVGNVVVGVAELIVEKGADLAEDGQVRVFCRFVSMVVILSVEKTMPDSPIPLWIIFTS